MDGSIEVVQFLSIEFANKGIKFLADDVFDNISSYSGDILDVIVSFLKYLEYELKGFLVNSIDLNLMIGEKIRPLVRSLWLP